MASQKAAHTASSIILSPALLTLKKGIGDPLMAQPMTHVRKNIIHAMMVILTISSWMKLMIFVTINHLTSIIVKHFLKSDLSESIGINTVYYTRND